MDWVEVSSKFMDYIKKYRYVALVLLAGLLLMILPEGTSEKAEVVPEEIHISATEYDLQDALAEILAQIDGAGKVKVLLTQAAGEETLYQTDDDVSQTGDSSDTRRDTVLYTNSQREEAGLVKRIDPPVYQGAIIVCQGGGSPVVRLAIVEAVASVTGLTSDHITVLKMK